MTEERKALDKALRLRMAALSEGEKQALIARGAVVTVEGRTLSYHNTLLVYLQSNGTAPTVVGGYRQWLAAGRQVQRGQHGMTIWFPVKTEGAEVEEDGVHFLMGTVFDVSQTAPVQAPSPRLGSGASPRRGQVTA